MTAKRILHIQLEDFISLNKFMGALIAYSCLKSYFPSFSSPKTVTLLEMLYMMHLG